MEKREKVETIVFISAVIGFLVFAFLYIGATRVNYTSGVPPKALVGEDEVCWRDCDKYPPVISFSTNQTDRLPDYSYSYEENGYLVTKWNNGTTLLERLTGVFRNSSATTYYEYRGLATIRYPHTPKFYTTYQRITNESRDVDLIAVSSLLENILRQPFIEVEKLPIEDELVFNPYGISYSMLTQNDTHIVVKELKSSKLESFRFFNRTFIGRIEVSADLISLNLKDSTYEIQNLRIIAGTTQHKLVVEWRWLKLQEQR